MRVVLFVKDSNLEYKYIQGEGGIEYEGQVLKDTTIRTGYGKLKWPDGSFFEGYWKNGKA